MIPFATFLPVVWCYLCTPQGWMTANLNENLTRAQCEHYVNVDAHYTGNSSEHWGVDKLAKIDHLKGGHHAWCLPVMAPYKEN
jgi:hypothetical protein